MDDLDLNFLLSFNAVVQAGSFSGAARMRGIPANTLSRHLQGLESSIGVKLIERSARRLTITPAGLQLYKRSDSALIALTQSWHSIVVVAKLPSGLIRVAAPTDFFEFFEPGWLSEFAALHPEIRFEFELGDSPTNLIGNAIDVAIRAGRLPDSQMVGRRLDVAHHVLVSAPSYFKRRSIPQAPADLCMHDCLVHAGVGSRWRLSSRTSETQVEVAGRFVVDNMLAIRHLAIAGLGIGLLPVVLAAKPIAHGLLIRVLPDYWRDGGSVYVIFPDRKHIPPAVMMFADFVSKHIRALGAQVATADSDPG